MGFINKPLAVGSGRNFAPYASYQNHDHIPAVVYSAGYLLATGADRADSLSLCMVDFASVPIARHSGNGSIRACARHLHVAVTCFGRTLAVRGKAAVYGWI